jgi:molybdenum cofactor guanylyltransferase
VIRANAQASANALILAGGQSRRMGKDKALLEVEGLPLLQRIHQVASACVDQVYIVGPIRPGFPIDWLYLPEPQPHQGPLLAFYHSLSQVSTDWILLLACDLPYLDVQTIQGWQKDLAQLPEAAIAYLAPRENKGPIKTYEALCGFYRDRCWPSLHRAIETGERSFQGWLATIEVASIPNPDPHVFTNWNSPADISSTN